jgi:hypothetical protein
MKKCSLTFEQRYTIAEHLRNNEERIKTARPLFKELAEHVGKELNLTITPDQIADIARVAKVTWEPRIHQRKGAIVNNGVLRSMEEKLARLEKDYLNDSRGVQQLQAEIAGLRCLVHSLYHQLGAKPPNGYTLPPAGTEKIAVANGAHVNAK